MARKELLTRQEEHPEDQSEKVSEKPQTKNLKELSDIELKAFAFELLQQQDSIAVALNAVQQELRSRSTG